jgi:hypothetical protein
MIKKKTISTNASNDSSPCMEVGVQVPLDIAFSTSATK